MPELVGLMRRFYAESGFVLDEERAAAGFEALLADARLGRVWLIDPDPPAAGYIVRDLRLRHGVRRHGRDGR